MYPIGHIKQVCLIQNQSLQSEIKMKKLHNKDITKISFFFENGHKKIEATADTQDLESPYSTFHFI